MWFYITELAGLELPGPLPSSCAAQLSVWLDFFCCSLFLCCSWVWVRALQHMYGFFFFFFLPIYSWLHLHLYCLRAASMPCSCVAFRALASPWISFSDSCYLLACVITWGNSFSKYNKRHQSVPLLARVLHTGALAVVQRAVFASKMACWQFPK